MTTADLNSKEREKAWCQTTMRRGVKGEVKGQSENGAKDISID